ncbi:MAG: hypothetical protein H0Z24_09170 [Thermosipho sp. (in: Bacteria)]|nr:hypothetical protein [Thermosipho sp. (in: thermotogales)]
MPTDFDINTLLDKYGESGRKQYEELKNLILCNETRQGKFIVFPSEAGFGKSILTNYIIAEYIKNQGERRFLIVKKFKEDVNYCVKYINEECGSETAVGITSDNWAEYQDNLSDISEYQVVVITHKRYNNLSSDDHLRNFFEDNRHTLIIDEQVQTPICSFSTEIYNYALKLLPHQLHKSFIDICEGLFNEITIQSAKPSINNSIIKCNPTIKNVNIIRQFESELGANWESIEPQKRNQLKDIINSIKTLYSSDCLYNNGTISCLDNKVTLWGLHNNIILDANGEIDKRYECSPIINIYSQPKLIDHSRDIIYHINFNTSKTSIRNSANYHEEICKEIMNRKREGDKTLIVVHKEFEDELISSLKKVGFTNISINNEYNQEEIAVAHFGNIIGQNIWRDFNQVWVVANPLYPMETYVLNWAFFSNQQITNDNIEMYRSRGKYAFRDETFEKIKFGCIVSEIYQAIKRINRDGRHRAEIFVVNSDPEVIEELRNQLKGIKFGGSIELNISTRDNAKKGKKSKGEQLADLLRKLEPGTYTKSDICQMKGWKDNGNFSKLLKNKEIISMINAEMIKVHHKTIEKVF